MTEHIIPIRMEDDNDASKEEPVASPSSVISEDLFETQSFDEPPAQPVQPKKTITTKPNTESKDFEDYVFESRSNYSLVNINVPEKIVLVIDRAQDEKCSNFIAGNARYTPMTMLRRCLHLFVKLKHGINKNHEFAIVLLNENDAKWVMNFTSDLRKVNNTIEKITLCEVEDTFDMNLVFEEINQHIKMPEELIAPPYIVRTVIFYGRSYTIPLIEFSEKNQSLLETPFFICDVLITHEPVDKTNHCKRIFELLQDIDLKGCSYFFPVGRSFSRLHNAMAKLLAHGLQRPIQKFQKFD